MISSPTSPTVKISGHPNRVMTSVSTGDSPVRLISSSIPPRLTPMSNLLLPGWGFPASGRRFHYFDRGETISICGRWMFTGPRDPGYSTGPGPEDCKACWKVLDKRIKAIDEGATSA